MARVRHTQESDAPAVQAPANPIAASTSRIKVEELPSEFKPYPKDVSIWYRTYTYDEVDEFNNMNADVDVDAAGKLAFLAKGVEAEGMDVQDATVNDMLYIGLLRKLSTFGTEMFSVHIRHEDGSRHALTYSMDDLYFEELEVPELPIVVDVTGKEMHFTPLTLAGHRKAMDDAGNSKPSSTQSNGGAVSERAIR